MNLPLRHNMKTNVRLRLHRMQIEHIKHVLLIFGGGECAMNYNALLYANAAMLAVRMAQILAKPGKEFRVTLKPHEAITLGLCLQMYTGLSTTSQHEKLELRMVLTPIHRHLA